MSESLKRERFGRYLILDHLVDGGMAKICRARMMGDQADKLVAIKMVQPKYSNDEAFKTMFGALTSSESKDGLTALESTANAITSIATAITKLSNAYSKIKPFLKYLPSEFIRGKVWDYLSSPGGRAAGGSVMANKAYKVGEFGPELFVPSGSGSIRSASGTGDGVTIIMNGVIDGESARRSIERLLQDSSRRTGAINLVGATL